MKKRWIPILLATCEEWEPNGDLELERTIIRNCTLGDFETLVAVIECSGLTKR